MSFILLKIVKPALVSADLIRHDLAEAPEYRAGGTPEISDRAGTASKRKTHLCNQSRAECAPQTA